MGTLTTRRRRLAVHTMIGLSVIFALAATLAPTPVEASESSPETLYELSGRHWNQSYSWLGCTSGDAMALDLRLREIDGRTVVDGSSRPGDFEGTLCGKGGGGPGEFSLRGRLADGEGRHLEFTDLRMQQMNLGHTVGVLEGSYEVLKEAASGWLVATGASGTLRGVFYVNWQHYQHTPSAPFGCAEYDPSGSWLWSCPLSWATTADAGADPAAARPSGPCNWDAGIQNGSPYSWAAPSDEQKQSVCVWHDGWGPLPDHYAKVWVDQGPMVHQQVGADPFASRPSGPCNWEAGIQNGSPYSWAAPSGDQKQSVCVWFDGMDPLPDRYAYVRVGPTD